MRRVDSGGRPAFIDNGKGSGKGQDMRLYRVNLTLEGVSGAATASSRFGTSTRFDFSLGGQRHYAVSLNEAVNVTDGMTVTAVLRDPNNWQTLEGWYNHQAGRIEGAIPIGPLRFMMILFCAIFVGVAALGAVYWGNGKGEHGFAIGMSIVFGLAALSALASWARGEQVWRELRAIETSI